MFINRAIAEILPLMPERLVWLFAGKYIAGRSIEDAVKSSRSLNNQGIDVTVDLLGEFITQISQAEANCTSYHNIIDSFEKNGIRGNYSLKPTMFGLLLDKEECSKIIRSIVAHAAKAGSFVRIDMEDSRCVDLEIDLFKSIKSEFPENVGLVFQAYLKRTKDDIDRLSYFVDQPGGLNLRLCKGIYNEPAAIAYKDYHEINENYLDDLKLMFEKGVYAAIATHDRPVILGAKKLIAKMGVPRDKYEFQMLYGVTSEAGKKLADEGHRVRVYVPFGEDWMPYSVRRLKENPRMVSYIIKAFLGRE